LADLEKKLNPADYVGRAPEQVEEFLEEHVKPLLEKHKEWLGMTADVAV
jgi:adenylosuccinate lyase